MKPLGRPILGPKREMPKQKVSPKPAKQDDYLQGVVDLKDMNGTVFFRGTRQECLKVIKKRAVLREQEKHAGYY